MKQLAALLSDTERMHIWRTKNGVQLNTMDYGASGWKVTSAPTLELALEDHFKQTDEEDAFS